MQTPRIPNHSTILKAVATVQANAQTRTLTPADCARARDAYKALLDYCARHSYAGAHLYMDAGAVPNSYTYRAETTKLTLALGADNLDQLGKPTPDTKPVVRIEAQRGYARKAAYGDGGRLRLSIDKPEGLKWTQVPPLRFRGKEYAWSRNEYLSL